MSHLVTAAQLYGRVALLRRRIVLQHTMQRVAIGVMAAILILAGIGLLTVGLVLWLRPLLGDLVAVLVVAFFHLAVGGVALVFAVREPASAELAALESAEVSALEVLTADASGLIGGIGSAGHSLQSLGNNLNVGLAAVSGLRSLLKRPNGVAPKP